MHTVFTHAHDTALERSTNLAKLANQGKDRETHYTRDNLKRQTHGKLETYNLITRRAQSRATGASSAELLKVNRWARHQNAETYERLQFRIPFPLTVTNPGQ